MGKQAKAVKEPVKAKSFVAQKAAGFTLISAWTISLGVLITALVWHLNILLIDHAGHIASAESFNRYGLNGFNPRAFLGYVQNLFYPPLEDALIGWSARALGASVETVYPLYLILVGVAYVLAMGSVARRFQNRWIQIWLGSVGLYLFWMYKHELLSYQGLGFIDLTVTGLSSQFLGGIFFWLLVRETLAAFRWQWLMGLLALTLLSHIVMGIVAALYVGVWIFSSRRTEVLKAAVGALLLTAFFWLPFVSYRSFIGSSKIFHTEPYFFFVFTLAAFGATWRVEKIRPLIGTSLVLWAPLVIGPQFEKLGLPFPIFHYYRFAIVALFLLVVAIAVWWESGHKRKFAVWALTTLTLGLVISFHPKFPGWKEHEYLLSVVDEGSFSTLKKIEGRDWIIDVDRSFGFGIDSILGIRNPSFQSMKGLFWESARSNTLLTSYFATLLGPPVVLDYYYFYGYPCEVQTCLMDRFFEDYSIQRVSIESGLRMIPSRLDRRGCFKEIFTRQKTFQSTLEKVGEFKVNTETYHAFEIHPDQPMNAVAQIIGYSRIRPVIPGAQSPQEQVMKDRFKSCEKVPRESFVFVEPKSWVSISQQLSKVDNDSAGETVKFIEVSTSRFEINVDSKRKRWVWIKLNLQPGFRLISESGEEVSIYPAFPGMLANLAGGKYFLQYDAPPVTDWGRGISLATVFAFLTTFLAQAWIRRRK